MSDTREAFDKIQRQFTSKNSIDVERATVLRSDWELAKQYMASRAQGDAEPAAYAAVNRIDKSAIAGLFQTEGMAGLGAQQCGGDVRPLVFGDTHPPKAQAVPEGWQLLPVEPTPEMREAFFKAQEECEDFEGVYGPVMPDHQYSAMLSVAPQPPQEG